jgi:hypothetical protein
MITEGVIHHYELKTVELYDYKCRITQCFKCQKYSGHTSKSCRNSLKCGNCGKDHTTKEYAHDERADRRRCAACNGGDHPSWSSACPARGRETERARNAYIARAQLHSIAASQQAYPNKSSPTISVATATQATRRAPADESEEDYAAEGTRKPRVLKRGRGRPPKFANIDTSLGATIDTFLTQGPPNSQVTASGTQAISETTDISIIEASTQEI